MAGDGSSVAVAQPPGNTKLAACVNLDHNGQENRRVSERGTLKLSTFSTLVLNSFVMFTFPYLIPISFLPFSSFSQFPTW